MLKRIFLFVLVTVFAISLVSCGEEEDVYSFYDAASKKEVLSEVVSETESKTEEISSDIHNENSSSEIIQDNYLEVEDKQLTEDKKSIEKTAEKALSAFLNGDIDGIKNAQPMLYDAFLENEQVSVMLSSVSDTIYETYGKDAEISLKIIDISAGSVDSINDIQLMVDSFECGLEVETVRNVKFEVNIEGSLGSDITESAIPAFYANNTWYIAVFTQIDMSMLQNMSSTIFDEMAGNISNDMIQDMLENMPQ